jgi:hypothetical protein
VQVTKEIKDEQNHESKAEAASSASVATIGVAAASEEQDNENNNDDECHAGESHPAGGLASQFGEKRENF